RLASFAGEALELRLAFLPPLRVQVGAEGRIEPGGPQPGALITLSGIIGSGPFADELRYLARHLRPDVEEELSRFLGDVAAQRIGDRMRAIARWPRHAALPAREDPPHYAIKEHRMLVRRAELAQLATDIGRLGNALA